MVGAKKISAAEWARRVERWQRSGLPAAEFGVREGISGEQLSWWKWHVSGHANPRESVKFTGENRA
jgi:transposase